MSVMWPSLAPVDNQGPHASNAFDTSLPADTGADQVSPSLASGIKSGNGLVGETPRQIAGKIWPGVNDTFYNRILIDPVSLEMGNLLSNQTRSIVVWNGFLVDKQLTGLQRVNDTGISLTQPVAPPYAMRPLEQLTYVLNVSTDGPAVINAQYIWTVDGVDYAAAVSGRRVVIWPYGPNWNGDVTEDLAWLTDVLRSFDGSEQRRSVRTKARRSFSYPFMTARAESARLENLLWGWQNRIYALPVFTDKPRMAADHLQGSTVLNVPTATYSFVKGGLAAVFADERTIEVVEVDSVEVGRLLLTRPLERNWPTGTTVMPMVLGHLPTSVPLARRTSQALTGVLTFTCDPVTVDPYTPDAAAPVLYDDIEVLLRQPNWNSGLSNDFQFQFDTIDQQTGAIVWDQTEEYPRIQRAYTWLLNGRPQILAFREMLGRRRGRAKTLWVPTWHDDFVVQRAIGAADTGIAVLENEFRQMVGVDPTRDRVMIRLRDGSVFYRKIVGLSSDGTNALLTLDAALGREVPAAQVKTIHLLMRSRLATDTITLTWKSDEVATVSAAFITVPA